GDLDLVFRMVLPELLRALPDDVDELWPQWPVVEPDIDHDPAGIFFRHQRVPVPRRCVPGLRIIVWSTASRSSRGWTSLFLSFHRYPLPQTADGHTAF